MLSYFRFENREFLHFLCLIRILFLSFYFYHFHYSFTSLPLESSILVNFFFVFHIWPISHFANKGKILRFVIEALLAKWWILALLAKYVIGQIWRSFFLLFFLVPCQFLSVSDSCLSRIWSTILLKGRVVLIHDFKILFMFILKNFPFYSKHILNVSLHFVSLQHFPKTLFEFISL